MAKHQTTSDDNRPCCRLLRELGKSPSNLKDPTEVAQALSVISQHCILMQLMGQSSVKWDLSKSTCYMARVPEAQTIIDEMGKTAAVHSGLKEFYALLNHMNGILANNATLKQISSRMQIFLAALREGEKKFGRVPDTSLISPDNANRNTLGAGAHLEAHPAFKNKSQMDGVAPKMNGDTAQNPEATKNAEQLQNQLQARPALQPKNAPSKAPTLVRK